MQKELNELRERQAAGGGANVSEEEHIRMEAEKSDLLGKLQQLQQEKDRQQTQLERLRHLLVNSSGRSTMSRRSGVGLESVNLEADEEPRRKQRKKHRDTW